jgi:hypothetical protein
LPAHAPFTEHVLAHRKDSRRNTGHELKYPLHGRYSMRFEIFGGFDLPVETHGVVPRSKKKHKAFWEQVDNCHPELRNARGCYVFAMNSGGGMTPWYVGKAERSSFLQECFTPSKISCYNDVLPRYDKGTPHLYFVAMLTPTGGFSQPSAGHQAIAFLEKMLIGQALKKNPDLCNTRDTALLRNMVVPGFLNTPKGRTKSDVYELKRVLE